MFQNSIYVADDPQVIINKKKVDGTILATSDWCISQKRLKIATATRYKKNHSLLSQLLLNKNSELVRRPDNHLKQKKKI